MVAMIRETPMKCVISFLEISYLVFDVKTLSVSDVSLNVEVL